MKIDLNKLNSENSVSFEEDLSFNEEDLKKVEIVNIPKCHVVGSIKKYDENLIEITMSVVGTMILECSVSLEETNFDFKIDYNETFDLNEKEENLQIEANTLDIFPIIWENIVLEKPTRIVKQNNKAVTSGSGWSLTDKVDDTENQLSELSKLLDMEEEK